MAFCFTDTFEGSEEAVKLLGLERRGSRWAPVERISDISSMAESKRFLIFFISSFEILFDLLPVFGL